MDPAAKTILKYLQLFLQHSVPVRCGVKGGVDGRGSCGHITLAVLFYCFYSRFGILLVEDGYGDRDVTLQINRAFYYATKQVNGMEAYDWLMEVGVAKLVHTPLLN